MTDPRAHQADILRPTAEAASLAWADRVRAEREQVERLREVDDPADFYAPMAKRFGQDPRRTDDPALELLRSMARAHERWLDIGAGGGRYSLPIALLVAQVHAVDPSPAMLDVLREGMAEHGIDNIAITAGRWPLKDELPRADVALMAHVGYDIEGFGTFLSAAEAAAARCVVVMRAGAGTGTARSLWPETHGEPRVAYPMLPELLVLLVARGAVPQVTLTERDAWGYPSREELLEASRQQLWLRPGSAKDRALESLIEARAIEQRGEWAIDWTPMQDGIVTWRPAR